MHGPVIRKCLSRIAWLYRVPVEGLSLTVRFESDLKARTVSDWSENEADQLLIDIHEMRAGIGEANVRMQEVWTVGDFCSLAEEYQAANLSGYSQIVARWEKEASMPQQPAWRRIVHKATGL